MSRFATTDVQERWLIVGGLAAVVLTTLGLAAMNDAAPAKPAAKPPTPYENCLLAANEPGPSGFATEVCEPLSPFYKPTSTVYVGPLSWANDDGSSVLLPPLAVQVADDCHEADDGVQKCVEALIAERQERAR